MLTEAEFEYYWTAWSEKEISNYSIKKNKEGKQSRKYLKNGYVHFDHRFWFPERKEELKQVLENGLKVFHKKHRRLEGWHFRPFIKTLFKTPRYRYQQEEGYYDLETKIRPICLSAHADALIFSFYAYVLTRKYEEYIKRNDFDGCAIAYRSNLEGKCNIQFAREAFDEVRRRGNCCAIALDIAGYFDNIDHILLKEKWSKMLGGPLPDDQFKLYKVLTQYSYVNKHSILKKYNVNLRKLDRNPNTLLDFVPGENDFQKYQRLRDDRLIVVNNRPSENDRLKGIPQGSGMSAFLSNLYLLDFDRDLSHQSVSDGFYYRRYCDDIVIICNCKDAMCLQRYVTEKINNEYFLRIQERKTEHIDFRPNSKGKIRAFNMKKQSNAGVSTTTPSNEKLFYKSLQYLGFEFNGQNIYIRSSSLSGYFRKMKSKVGKTIAMAYGDGGTSDKIWIRQLLDRYTHLGKRNFLVYAYNASKAEYRNSRNELKVGMNSPAIRKQLSRHFNVLFNALESKNSQRHNYKVRRGDRIQKKRI